MYIGRWQRVIKRQRGSVCAASIEMKTALIHQAGDKLLELATQLGITPMVATPESLR